MKKILLFLATAAFALSAEAQTGTDPKAPAKPKTCFEEYYESFIARGSVPVPDGEQNVVFSARTDTSCFCGEGKITVLSGQIIPTMTVKKTDGTYEPAKKKLSPKTGKGEAINPNVFQIRDGMSHTFITDDDFIINLFFIDYVNRKVVPNAEAPSPDAIAGRQPASTPAMTPKEKEIIQKAYEGLKFENGKSRIKEASYPHLNLLASMLLEKKDYKIHLNGYTDNTGKAESNLVLSKNRAAAVKAYLIKKGVEESRIVAEGFGIENPIGDNKTAEGRAKNRRVEFIVVQ